MNSLLEHDLVGIAAAIREGDASAEQVTRLCLDRLEGQGRALNAVVRLDAQVCGWIEMHRAGVALKTRSVD